MHCGGRFGLKSGCQARACKKLYGYGSETSANGWVKYNKDPAAFAFACAEPITYMVTAGWYLKRLTSA